MRNPKVAIVDYEMGNLFSVKNACEQAGMEAAITSNAQEIRSADGVILPGVGAFGTAMETLRRLGLVEVLQGVAGSGQGKPFIGICLGMQLLMTESLEFGRHAGLNLIEGQVVKLETSRMGERKLKVPQIGWNQVYPHGNGDWKTQTRFDSPFAGLTDGEYMYFVHSFYVKPLNQAVVLSQTAYGPTHFCSSLKKGNIVAFQFHPERSGPAGLKIYQNIREWIKLRRDEDD